MKYQIVMRRITRHNTGKSVVWNGTRIKNARGELKSLINSSLDTLEKHDFMNAVDISVDRTIPFIHLWDEQGNLILGITYEIVQVEA